MVALAGAQLHTWRRGVASEGDSTSNFGQGGQGPVKWGTSNFERWVGPRQILSRRWAPWGGRLSLCESVKFRAVGPSKADERATTTMSMLQRSTAAAPCAAQQARTAALLRRRTDHSHHADQPCAAGAWKTSLAAPRQLAAPRRRAAAAWRPWLDGADVHSTESTFTAAILQRLRVF